MIKKIALFFIFSLFLFGCTTNQFSGEFSVDAEIIGINDTIVSIKYKVGSNEIYDDLNLENKTSIRLEWQHKDIKQVPLRVYMYGYSDESVTKKTHFKYYFGANLICEHEKFDYDTLVFVAKQNEGSFSWKFRDGVDLTVKKDKQEKEKEVEEEQGKKL